MESNFWKEYLRELKSKSEENFKNYDLNQFIKYDWLIRNILSKNAIEDLHPITNILCESERTIKFKGQIECIKRKNETNYKRIIRRLKDRENFSSLISEIEVLAFLSENNDIENLEYEQKKKYKHSDIKFNIGDYEIFIEVITFNRFEQPSIIAEQAKEIEELLESRKEINYSIKIIIYRHMDELTKNNFIKFILNLLKEGNLTINEEYYFKSKSKKECYASIVFKNDYLNNKPYVICTMLPQKIEIKNKFGKILNKLDKFKDNNLNILIIDISNCHSIRFNSLDELCFGEIYIEFLFPKECQDFILYRRKRYEKKSLFYNDKKISAVIGFDNYDFNNREMYENPNAYRKLPDDILKIFDKK